MPMWPMLMPSETVGAPNICGTPPPARTPSHPFAASRSRCALHGVISLKSEATPMIGLVEVLVGEPDGAEHGADSARRPSPPRRDETFLANRHSAITVLPEIVMDVVIHAGG